MADASGSLLLTPMGRAVFRALLPEGPRAGLVILVFHRVLPKRDPLRPFEPTAEEFHLQMRWLRGWFNVLPLGEATRRLAAGSLPERALAITFDDGYADNHDVALPILVGLGLPATFFIAAGFLDGGRMFNDTVVETVRRVPGPEIDLGDLGLGTCSVADDRSRVATISSVLGRVKYLGRSERERQVERVASRADGELPDDLMMTSAQVAAIHRAGMEIGAHTLTHPILVQGDLEDARREMSVGRQKLESIIGDRVGLFAYPNGRPERDYNTQHVSLVRELGFDAAVSTAWGAARRGADRFQLPRISPWDANPWRYGTRLARTVALNSYEVAR